MLVANTVIDDADCQVKTTGIRFEEIPVAKASLGLQAGAEVVFEMALDIRWSATLLVGDATIGQCVGHYAVKNFTSEVQPDDWDIQVQVERQYKKANPMNSQEVIDTTLLPYESIVLDIINKRGLEPFIASLREVHASLVGAKDEDPKSIFSYNYQLGQMKPTERFRKETQEDPHAQHHASAQEFAEGLRQRGLGKKYSENTR